MRKLTLLILGCVVFVTIVMLRKDSSTHVQPPRMTIGKPTEKSDYIKFTGKTWMTFTEITSPSVYRACVPRPYPETYLISVVTGGIVEDTNDMTIVHCVYLCIGRNCTYAALGKGTQCLCGNMQDELSELGLSNYRDSTFCDIPCSGDAQYNCGGERYLSIYRTNISDHRCSNVRFKTKGNMPLVALASYPRSGNTWTRQLIEKASGIYTGSSYWKGESRRIFTKSELLGGNIDFKSQQTICVKTHTGEVNAIKTFVRAILLIRNPRRSMVAEVFRRRMIVQRKSPDVILKYFQSADWDKYVQIQIKRWENIALNWIYNCKELLVVPYEDLTEDTLEEINRIMNFLNANTTDERMRCSIQEHPSSKSTGLSLGNFFRQTRVYLTEDPYSEKHKTLINRSVQNVNATLIKKGLRPLPSYYSITVY